MVYSCIATVSHNGYSFIALNIYKGEKQVLSILPRFTGYKAPSIKQVTQLLKTGKM